MTVVLAKRFGEVISLVADTMISDRDHGREDAFPGRLKIIPLAPNLTVAYAGHADPARHVIRGLFHNGVTDVIQALETLREFTASKDHDVEFLVASHQPMAALHRVWKGRVSDPLGRAAIGEKVIQSSVYDRLPKGQDRPVTPADFYSAFLAAFTSSTAVLGEGVGGFPVGLDACPTGHRFRGHSFHHDWKPIEVLPGVEQHQSAADMQTGDWTFHHAIMRTKHVGIAVLAAQIQQARRAYIYAPLLDDTPKSVILLEDGVDWTEHQEIMNRRTVQALDEAVARMAAALARRG